MAEKELPESEKSPHSEVDYEHPAKGKHHCGTCGNLIVGREGLRCKTVKPPIRLGDWCKRWEE